MPVFDPGVPWLRGSATLTNGSTTVTTDGVITLNEILEGDRLYVFDGGQRIGPFEIVGGEDDEIELREAFEGATGSYAIAIDRNPITRTGAKTLRDVADILGRIGNFGELSERDQISSDLIPIGPERDAIKDALDVTKRASNLADLTNVAEARANLGTFSSVAEVQSRHIPAVLVKIETEGFASPKDGGGAKYYRKLASENDRPGDWMDASGARFGLIRDQRINVKMFGAVGDGGTDDTEALQDALDFGGSVEVPSGQYVVTSPLEITQDGTRLMGAGADKAEIVVPDSFSGGANVIQAIGSVGAEVPLAATATRHDVTLQTVSAHDATVGDIYLLKSQRNCLSPDAGDWQLGVTTGGGFPSYFAEPLQIIGVDSSTQFEFTPPLLFPDYRPDNTLETDPDSRPASTVQKLIFIDNISIQNITIKRNGSSDGIINAIRLEYCRNALVENVTWRPGAQYGRTLVFSSSMGCKAVGVIAVRDIKVDVYDGSTNKTALNGILTYGSWHTTIHRCEDYNGSQPVDITWSTADGHPSLYTLISECRSVGARGVGITVHPGCYGTVIANNIAEGCHGGIYTRSPANVIIGNRVRGLGPLVEDRSGIAVQDGFTQRTVVTGNQVEGYHRLVYADNASSVGEGPPVHGLVISGNHLSLGHYGILIDTHNTDIVATSDFTGLLITDNLLEKISVVGIRLNDYLNGAVVRGNVIRGPMKAGDVSWGIYAANNIYSPVIENNTLIDLGPDSTGIRTGNLADTDTFPPASYEDPNTALGMNHFIGDIGTKYLHGNSQTMPGWRGVWRFGEPIARSWSYNDGQDILRLVSPGAAYLHLLTGSSTPQGGIRIGTPTVRDAARFVFFGSDFRWDIGGSPLLFANFDDLRPGSDDEIRLGNPNARWNAIYATSGTVHTSDAREKTPLRHLTEAENAVAIRLSKLPGVYQWLSAIEKKGEAEARLHVGLTAQAVKDAFDAEGLDGFRYGVLCWDEWDAEDAEFDEDGNEITPAREAGNRYGIRYDELAQWQAAGWNARLEALEGGGNG